jgi:hypothetical protein
MRKREAKLTVRGAELAVFEAVISNLKHSNWFFLGRDLGQS